MTTTAGAVTGVRRGFRSFRATRPFWGGLWAMLAGLWVVKVMSFSMVLVFNGGWGYSAGNVIGGAMVAFGLIAWVAPAYKTLAGVGVFMLSLAAFPAANLGGLLIGSLLGIFGSSMIWAWGEKKPKGLRRRGTAPDGDSDNVATAGLEVEVA